MYLVMYKKCRTLQKIHHFLFGDFMLQCFDLLRKKFIILNYKTERDKIDFIVYNCRDYIKTRNVRA